MVLIKDLRPLMFFEAARRTRRPKGTCRHCGGISTDGKTECLEHLHLRPYIANLLTELKQHEVEASKIVRKGKSAVDLQGMHVSEIMSLLEIRGAQTKEALARAAGFPIKLVAACIGKMRDANLVKMQTRSGQVFVKLVE